MLELQQLSGELDVGERAPTEFEVEVGVLTKRDAFGFDPRLHPTDVPAFLLGKPAGREWRPIVAPAARTPRRILNRSAAENEPVE
ncbi:unannotated protein [freshwater metagenome]|uniref:Unannotated protein n=1 Tax=freshwater metagenome TaxID=449393 RepID=A0A6J5YJT8_9ZZZZ